MFKISLGIFITALTFSLSCNQVSAEIIETNEISSIQDHLTNDSLVFFNITDTLYKPATTLADNKWRTYFNEKVNKIVTDKRAAEGLVNRIKNLIVSKIPKKAVEDITPQLIVDLQNKQIPVLGITQKLMATPYADNFGLITRNHLLSIGIDLEKTLSYLNLKKESDDIGYSFAYGLIFTNKNPVGPAVLNFLNRLQKRPSKIIMIDNSKDSLMSAETALASTNTKFEGFRYGREDIQKMKFDPIIGNIQFFAYINDRKIISDDEAIKLQKSHPEVDYTLMLDNFIREQSKLY